jgi:hypothetical protein
VGCNRSPEPTAQPPVDQVQPEGPATAQSRETPEVVAPASESTDDSSETAPSNESNPTAADSGTDSKAPLFKDWPKPQVVFFLTGQQHGYIEPCGCTGLENQKGGLARRYTLLKQLRGERGWNVVPLDVGNQVRRYGKQPEIKFQRTADAFRTMQYAAVTLGDDDLRLTVADLFGAIANPDGSPSMFIGANVALLARDLQPTIRIVEAGGKKIGITAVLGSDYEQKLQGDEIVHEPPVDALKRAADELKQQNCDYYVLLAHASLDESRDLARAAPLFNLVVTAGGVGEPTDELEEIEGTKSLMAQVGAKAMYAGVVGLFDDAEHPVRYQRVPLDDRFADSPEMIQLLADYQEELRRMSYEELGIRPQPHPSGHKFVGTETCAECHTKAYQVWENTPHAHATDSLVHPPNQRGHIPRHYDPECLSCHVTGWEPQKYFPFESGYLSLEKTPQLQQNGCENCHGPGSAHVAAENGEGNLSMEQITALRKSMQLPLAGGVAERKCMECHDLDNSPDFHVKGAFAKYWKEVEHKGKD